ncbi:MAG: MFS transporter [Betaproteobacteria bacterium]
MRRDRINVLLLAAAQTLVQSGSVLAITIAALVGGMLAPDRSLATLPVSAMILGTAAAAIPAALLMRRIGRRTGFLAGAGIGLLAALTAALGVRLSSFALFVAGHALFGAYQAFANYYRFAAGEAAAPDFRSRAISWVIAGGVIAALLGPQLAYWSRDLQPTHLFLGSYLAQGGLALLALAFLAGLRMPAAAAGTSATPQRSRLDLVTQPKFAVAVLGSAVGYAVMLLVMTATPVAMIGCGYAIGDAVRVIQWHVLAMFAPSFFTGALIARLGAAQVMAVGFCLLIGHVAVALSGETILHFGAGLVLLGAGWNFSFVGGTTLLTTAYRESERTRAQAINDFVVFGTVAVASLSSGWLYHRYGWQVLNMAALPVLGLALLATLALLRRESAAAKRDRAGIALAGQDH